MPVYPSGGTIAQSVGSPGFGPAPAPSYNASASVRFNPADTAYFSYIPTLQGSRTTWTWSGWVKRSGLSTLQNLFAARSGNESTIFRLATNDTLLFYSQNSTPTATSNYTTAAVFRDVSAWYHVLVAIDTTQTTAVNRVSIYINGVLQTLTAATTVSQYAQLSVNGSGYSHAIGFQPTIGEYFNGYLADINFVDGLALTPSSFTATDANTGQLVPAQYTGNRGTNGFYLPFSGAALAVDLGQNPKTTAQDFPYWPYNTLLVDTTSTNGQQNNDFANESQFAVSVPMTRAGNTTQGNFSPFTFGGGTTQANGYYSGYFDGTGDYLSLPASGNASYINGTGNFTIDFWVYYNALPTGSVGANTGCSWYAQDSGLAIVSPFNLIQAGNTWYLYADTGAGTWNIFSQVTIATTTLSSGQWYHVACVRDSTNIRLYINGVQVGTASIGAASIWQNTVRNLYLFGAWQNTAGSTGLNGYVSNYRLVKGTCLYPNGTTFTVPTTPLTAVTNTSLLTCQSSQFIDNSTNAFAITANGNAQPLPTNPFGMTAWSGYFDGTGDYLTVANNAALDPNTDSFCMECWVYITGTTGNNQGFNGKGVAGTSGYSFYITNALLLSFVWNGTGGATITGGTLSLNTWNHVAVVRNSGVIRLYLNGVGAASSTACTTDINSTNGLFIGQARGANPILGNMSNYRMTKGTLPPGYDATATTLPVPTAPLTAISGTSLLTCQSSTFIDNSTNAFSINVFGNSYTGTLNNPFGNPVNYTTPPVQSWSTYHAASGDTLSLSQTALTALSTSNAWTIEFWAYKTASTAATYSTVLSTDVSGNASGTVFSFNNTTFACGGQGHAGFPIQYTPVGSVSLNQWYHFAIVKNNGVLKIYINGIEQLSVTQSTTFPNIGQPLRIGNRSNGDTPFIGYVSNIRFVNGTAVYNSNFTPPTSPLSIIGNTTLLTCQSNRLVDNSFNNFVITKIGNTAISPVSPFFPAQAYSAASNGGSMYFDGTGDYLNIIKSSFLNGTQDFTFQAWIYPTSTNTGTVCGFGANTPTGYCGLNWRITSTTMQTYWSTNGTTETTISGGAIKQNVWQHVAATRSGSTIRLFLDGVQVGTGTVSGALYTGSVANGALNSYTIGCYFSSNAPGVFFTGYISSFEYLNGVSRYNTSFTPPVLPQTQANLTAVLLNGTNAGIYDATGQNVIETAGNVQVSTAVKKFGESSMFFDGSGDYLVIPTTNAPCQFGTADFTIEAWIYSTSIANQQMILSNRIAATGTTNFGLQIFQSKVRMGNQNVDYLVGAITLSSNTWYHVAVSRISGTFRLFINGVLDVASVSAQTMSSNAITVCGGDGSYSPTSYPFIGYIQDLRISKGVGRYSGAFTPPAAAFAYNQYDIGNQQWTPNNLSVTAGVNQDNLFDSPSNYGTDTGLGGQVRGNYCTWNPLKNSTTLSNGNLSSVNASTSQWLGVAGTFGMTSGKWYWECTPTVGPTSVIGLSNSSYNTGGHPGADANSWGYYDGNGNKYFNGAASAYGASFTTNNVIGVAFDADVGTLTFYKNGASQGVAFSGLTSGPYFPACGVLNSTNLNINTGQRAFAHAAPAGFKCLVSTNLPTTNNIGATSSTRATDYFNTVLWSGDSTSSRSITGVGFQPDIVWGKSRSTTYDNNIFDVVRGAGNTKVLTPNATYAEGYQGTALTYGAVSAFNSDGFTVVPGTSPTNAWNQSGQTFVAWNWKANGAGVANTVGTLPSTVSANTTNGVSIVTYTSQSSGSGTIGHGLGVAPTMIINKPLTGSFGWSVYHQSLGNLGALVLNSNAGLTSSATYWNSTSPTTTVFSQGSAFAGLGTMVAYCFANVPGFSSLGSFTSNGAADNAFVYTGFAPRFIMLRVAAVGLTGNWIIFDTARNPTNIVGFEIYPNSNVAEVNSADLDILSNGFKLRNAGFSSGNYIYAAFAEFPFKYSRAR